MRGLIIKSVSGFYYVKTDSDVIECKARGRFRNDGTSLFVGDLVEIDKYDKSGTITKVYDRKNYLLRPPVANVDKLFIISSAVTPAVNLLLIDRMTALCEYNNIEPIIVFNKCDADDLSAFSSKYQKVGYKTIECSALTLEGTDTIKEELYGCVSAFTGNSGVGKSSLLNVIFPNLQLSTGEVSEKLGRGRHTTRHTELFEHEYNGYVADTPGFSALEYDGDCIPFRDALPDLFPEFLSFADRCKFTDCKHIGEKGCAICEAVKSGGIDFDRHSSYVTIYNELKDFRHWKVKKNNNQ